MMPYYKSQAGFSVVELMIAMLLSLTLGVAVISVFVNNTHSFNQDENIARMQDDAGHALRELAFDISMAGHYADLHAPQAVTQDANLAIGTDCGPAGELNWMYRTVEAGTGNTLSLLAIDNATGAAATAVHSCFGAGEVLDGTDVVMIKRVAGSPSAALNAGSVYLRTNGTVGDLFRAPFPGAPTMPVAPPAADWEYRPSVYFVRPFANVPGDDIPTLCRKVLRGGNPDMVTECLAAGIEDLQVEYGIDTSLNGDPNVYLPNPTLAQMQNVVTARIFILARTTEIDTRYTNDKTYNISNSGAFTPNDAFHRRVYSTSVSIQNIRSLNMMGF
ncbi:MAG: PilW family protein [Woeseiaceae bacterium]|nr:PilW family protein [Woeseiaceae bacterium]